MNGHDHKTYWPDLHADGADQRIQSVTVYQIDFAYDTDHTKTITIDSLDKFHEYVVGDEWKAEANRVGMFHVTEKIDGPKT